MNLFLVVDPHHTRIAPTQIISHFNFSPSIFRMRLFLFGAEQEIKIYARICCVNIVSCLLPHHQTAQTLVQISKWIYKSHLCKSRRTPRHTSMRVCGAPLLSTLFFFRRSEICEHKLSVLNVNECAAATNSHEFESGSETVVA